MVPENIHTTKVSTPGHKDEVNIISFSVSVFHLSARFHKIISSTLLITTLSPTPLLVKTSLKWPRRKMYYVVN